MGVEYKRLRDMPGVMEVEALCQVPSYFDERNIAQTMEKIDAVSIALFSLSYFDTDYDCFDWADADEMPSEEQWDTMLSNAMKPYGQTRPFWEALGWDITDGQGSELDCAHYFAEQIIIAESGWIDGVKLTPDGSGKEPDLQGPALTEAELADRLEREAAAFLLRKR